MSRSRNCVPCSPPSIYIPHFQQKQQGTASNVLNAARGIAQRHRSTPSYSSLPPKSVPKTTVATAAPALETASSNRFRPPTGSSRTGSGGINSKHGMSSSDLGRGKHPIEGTSGSASRDSDFASRRGGDYRATGLPAQEAPTRVQRQPLIPNQSGGGLLVLERRFGSFSAPKRAAGVGTYEEPHLGERVASTAGTDRRNNDSRSIAPPAAANELGRRDQASFGGGFIGPRPTVTGIKGENAAASRGSSWGVGHRTVTREDLTRLDEEIANLSKTVEQVRMTAFPRMA